MFNLDLTEVKESTGFKPVPAGEYTVLLDDCQIKETKSGSGEYINAKFRILGGEQEGKFLFSMFNIKNENPKAVEIGLQQLKMFMKCAGFADFKLTNVLDLVGYRANAVVKIKTDSYGEKAVISYFKPAEKKEDPKRNQDSPF